ncbi:MAG: pilin [Pseudomonas sp.]|nr:pilin [Pseudomonas sp.]
MKAQKGFTLIELMIVVAIIGILAAIALPAYQDYTARSQMSEAITLASGARTAVTEFYTSNGTFPASNTSAGLSANATDISGNYVASVAVSTGGLITTTMKGTDVSEGIRSKTMLLSPTTNAGSVEWTCKTGGSAAVDNKYLPSTCR